MIVCVNEYLNEWKQNWCDNKHSQAHTIQCRVVKPRFFSVVRHQQHPSIQAASCVIFVDAFHYNGYMTLCLSSLCEHYDIHAIAQTNGFEPCRDIRLTSRYSFLFCSKPFVPHRKHASAHTDMDLSGLPLCCSEANVASSQIKWCSTKI